MNKPYRLLTAALALAAASVLGASAAQAQTVITSLPYTISNNGLYVLNSNLSSAVASGSLITISASNVTLDFQGHYISGPVGNTAQTTNGILANERANVTIKNGTIAYCYIGIEIEGSGSATTNNVDYQVDNMRVTYCYGYGINIGNAPSSRVTNCQISQIGFSTASGAYGININGSGVTVQDCTVNNILGTAGSSLYCIYSVTGSFVRQCQVSNAVYGVRLGIYQDNLAHNCTNAFLGGTDGGGNTHD